MRGWIVACVGATITLGLAMVAGAAPPPPLPADVARGERLYNTGSCHGCHGKDAVKPIGPSLIGPPLIGPNWRFGGDPRSIAASIRDGRGYMKAKGGMDLSEEQIGDLTAYLKYREKTATPEERALAVSRMPAGPPTGIVKTALESYRVEVVVRGLEEPYGFDLLPDGRIIVSEAPGTLRVIDHGKLLPEPVVGAPTGDIAGMQQWMRRANMSLAAHPNYKANGWIYLLTARQAAKPPRDTLPQIATIWRGRLRGNRWVDGSKIIEFPIQATDSLRMKFGPDGHLYVGTPAANSDYTGTQDEKSPPQDLAAPDGKILRMTDDGSVPPDNPFVGKPGAYPYVWSYGHREPSGLTFDGNGELWSVEDGPHGGDELNHVRKAHNYGWPVITWGHRYDEMPVASHTERAGMEQPVVSWAPSPAVSDVEWYNGAAFPAWRGSFLVGSMKQRDLLRVTVDGDRGTLVEVVLRNVARLRDIATGADGTIYLLTDSGEVLRLVPANQ